MRIQRSSLIRNYQFKVKVKAGMRGRRKITKNALEFRAWVMNGGDRLKEDWTWTTSREWNLCQKYFESLRDLNGTNRWRNQNP